MPTQCYGITMFYRLNAVFLSHLGLLIILILPRCVYPQVEQQNQGVVCSSLIITNSDVQNGELLGRYGCEYILKDVTIKNIRVSDFGTLNKMLSTIVSIEGVLSIDSISYSGPSSNREMAMISFPRLTFIGGKDVKNKRPVQTNTKLYNPSLLIRRYQIKTKDPPAAIEFPSLKVVRQGDIAILASLKYAYANTVNWSEFMQDSREQQLHVGFGLFRSTCSNRCSKDFKHCFGPSERHCQHRWMGAQNCDSQCIGGCMLPSDPSKCFACKNMRDIVTNTCVTGCPNAYDSQGNPRPDGRFSLADRLCVRSCPDGLVRYDNSCQLRCPRTNTYEKDGRCYPCDPPCSESIGQCYPESMNATFGVVKNDNVANFANCTKIVGDLILTSNHVSHELASRYLANITTVVGKLAIRGTSFVDVNFLSNLQTIENRWVADTNTDSSGYASLIIEKNDEMKNLSLPSMRAVRGKIRIADNKKLCAPPDYVLQQRVRGESFPNSTITVTGNKAESSADCACSPKCKMSPPPQFTSRSCMAPGDPTQCLQCASYTDSDTRECLSLEQCQPSSDRYVSDAGQRLCSACHSECQGGCTGPRAIDCKACKSYRRSSTDECVSRCNPDSEYGTINTCEPCHPGCSSGCYGPGNVLCSSKETVPRIPTSGCRAPCQLIAYSSEKDLFTCHADTCPDGFYRVDKFSMPGVEVISPDECFEQTGRPLAQTRSSPGYCAACSKNCAKCTSRATCTRCMPGTFQQPIEFGSDQSVVDGALFTCVETCLNGYFKEKRNGASYCKKCQPACHNCTGPSVEDCIVCRLRQVRTKDDSNSQDRWKCVENCPDDYPLKKSLCKNSTVTPGEVIEEELNSDCVSYGNDWHLFNESQPTWLGECTASMTVAGRDTRALKIGFSIASVILVLIIIAIVVVVCQCRRRAESEKDTALYRQQLEPTLEDNLGTRVDSMASSALGATGPDTSTMKMIPESKLTRKKMLGKGAFGTVYSGIWQPADTTAKIPVALKVLRRRGPVGFTEQIENSKGDRASKVSRPESSPSPIDEVIQEARIMCSVNHPCCIRVVGLCLGAEDIILVSTLMPHGSLLDLLLQEKMDIANGNQRKFGAWHLLTWAHQIAEGMNYLQDRGIIHRDLATRNVLVKSLSQVRITDFGLAKLLNAQQRVYRPAAGGSGERLPFKWLALESLEVRVFTHQSDVWSYAVTVWEIFMYGDPPYGPGITPSELIALLIDGNRLPQPPTASIDTYTPMIKCWLRDPEERPTFAELSALFKDMANDPGKYLAIPGDTYFREPVASVQPPSPSELLADLGVSNQNYIESSGMPESRPQHISNLMDAEEYLALHDDLQQPSSGRQSRRSKPPSVRLSSQQHPSPRLQRPNRATQRQSYDGRHTYTSDPTVQSNSNFRSTSQPSGVDLSTSGNPSFRMQSAIDEDYMTPTNTSPNMSTAPLLSSSSMLSESQRASNAPVSVMLTSPTTWRPSSGQNNMTAISPTSSHRETVI